MVKTDYLRNIFSAFCFDPMNVLQPVPLGPAFFLGVLKACECVAKKVVVVPIQTPGRRHLQIIIP